MISVARKEGSTLEWRLARYQEAKRDEYCFVFGIILMAGLALALLHRCDLINVWDKRSIAIGMAGCLKAAHKYFKIVPKGPGRLIESIAKGEIQGNRYFDKAAWEVYFGDVGEEPPLPEELIAELDRTCPFSGDEKIKVKDTHMLVLIPANLNGSPFTLNRLGVMVQEPNQGNKTKFASYNSYINEDFGDAPVEQSYWALMTRDLVPDTRSKSYAEQKEYVRNAGYCAPKLLEAATCILAEHVVSGAHLYEKELFMDSYIRCEEELDELAPVVVGNFGSKGLYIHHSLVKEGNVHFGIAALKRYHW